MTRCIGNQSHRILSLGAWMARHHRRPVNICDTCGCLHHEPTWTCRSCSEAIHKVWMKQACRRLEEFGAALQEFSVTEAHMAAVSSAFRSLESLEHLQQALVTSTRLPSEILFQDYFPVDRPLLIPPLLEEPTKRPKQHGPIPRGKWWLR